MQTRPGLHPRTFHSWEALRLPDRSKRALNCPTDVPTVSARNTSLRMAHTLGAKALLFIDSDMEFEPDAYERLNRVRADICCGLFWNRTAPSYPTITRKDPKPDGKFSLLTIVPDGEIQDVDACGMAFTLIRRPVIEWAMSADEQPPFVHGVLGEDFTFCLKAKEAGFTVKCDTSLRIAHRGDVGFNGQAALIGPDSNGLSFPFGSVNERESWRIH